MRVQNDLRIGAPIAAAIAMMLAIPFVAQPQGQGKGKGKGGAPVTARAGAPFDPTGYWVSIVTEDWRYRMVTPPKGAYGGVPMNAEARKVAESWDPAKDEAANQQCKAYGAAALMRVPGRLHITWENDTTLKIETDAGTQTRLLHFGGGAPQGVEPSWQGYSVAQWEFAQAATKGAPRTGDLKIVTTRMLPGYLRKNGVPYSGNAVLTEWVDHIKEADGTEWLNFNTEVRDPQYLTQPFITSSHFKKQAGATGFAPEACFAK